jgi:hypothetical protein
MNKKVEKQMARMVESVQPHCDDKIIAAMTCSHAGSMGSFLASKFLGGFGGIARTSELPLNVFIAVGEKSIYAFDYAPKGFNFKIKKEAARWLKDDITVEYEISKTMATFVLATKSGDYYPLEVPIFMGGKELVEVFLASFNKA